MVSLKKAALAVLALGVTGVASAAMYVAPPAAGCTVGNNVTVPCEKKGWSFSGDALVVQTNNVGPVTQNITTSTTSGVTTINDNVSDLSADWQWGFEFAAAYYFGTGNDINVNWTHFVHTTNQTATGGGTTTNVLTGDYISDSLATSANINQIDTSLGNSFNAVNIEFGQLVHFGPSVDTRFHAGLQWAQIDEDLTQTGLNTANTLAYDQSYVDSEFDGIGPRFGADTAYNFGNGVSLFGNVAGAVLVGQTKTTSTETFTNAAGNAVISASANGDSGNSVVPEVEAKLGIRYTQALAQGDLSAEVGWEAVNYWDAQNVSSYNDTVSDSGTSNFGYDGIFFGLKWMGNA